MVKAYASELQETCFLKAASVTEMLCTSDQHRIWAGGQYQWGWSLESVNFCMSFFKSQGKKLGEHYSSQGNLEQPNKGACQHHCCTHLELWVNGLSHSQELNHLFLFRKVTSAAINSWERKLCGIWSINSATYLKIIWYWHCSVGNLMNSSYPLLPSLISMSHISRNSWKLFGNCFLA